MNTMVALPIVAATPTTAPAMPQAANDPVIALAQRVLAAWAEYGACLDKHVEADNQVIDWRNANPRPQLRPCIVGSSDDLRAARAELKASFQDWEKRERAVKKRTGYTRTDRAQLLASDRFDEIRDQLMLARPITLAGLCAKADAATQCDLDAGLLEQIAYDIGWMSKRGILGSDPFSI